VYPGEKSPGIPTPLFVHQSMNTVDSGGSESALNVTANRFDSSQRLSYICVQVKRKSPVSSCVILTSLSKP
jgi:hypothetical protein